MERVSIHHGKHPTVVVAPHAFPGDDFNTNILAETIAARLDASYVINHGWQKSLHLDISKEKANCNNTNHLVDVVYDEFLAPFIRMVKRITKLHKKCMVVILHGVSDHIRKIAGDNGLDIILGYGDGKPKASFSCTYGIKDYLSYNLQRNSIGVYEGKAKGRYSGYSKTNLNQYWRQHIIDLSVESIQLEIVRELRADRTIATLTGDYISEALDDILENRYWKKPTSHKSKYI